MFEELKKLKGNFVYVIEDEYGLIKIGISSDPYTRFKTLLNMGGCNFKNYYISDNVRYANKIEKKMHDIYRKYRINGEWFKGCLYTDIIDKLKTIISNHNDINMDNKKYNKSNPDIVCNLALQVMKYGGDNILCYDFSKGKILSSDLQQIKQIAWGASMLFDSNNDIANKILESNNVNELNTKDIQMFLLNVIRNIGDYNFYNVIDKNIIPFYSRVIGLFKLNQANDDVNTCSLVFDLFS